MSLIDQRVEKRLRELLRQAAREAQICPPQRQHRNALRSWLPTHTEFVPAYVPDTATRERIANELHLSFVDVDDWIEQHSHDGKGYPQLRPNHRKKLCNKTQIIEQSMLHLLDKRQNKKSCKRTNTPQKLFARQAPVVAQIATPLQCSNPHRDSASSQPHSPRVRQRVHKIPVWSKRNARHTYPKPKPPSKHPRVQSLFWGQKQLRRHAMLTPRARLPPQFVSAKLSSSSRRASDSRDILGAENVRRSSVTKPIRHRPAASREQPPSPYIHRVTSASRDRLCMPRKSPFQKERKPNSSLGLHHLLSLLKKHQPDLMGRAGWMLEKYSGKETELFENLRRRFKHT